MQLELQNRTLGRFIPGTEFLFPSYFLKIKKIYRLIKSAFAVLSYFGSVIPVCLYWLLHSKDSISEEIYRKVWSKTDSNKDTKGISEDSAVRPFKIQVPDSVLNDLKKRLGRTRFEDPLEDTRFRYGFNPNYLRKVIDYWKNQYQWRKHEKELNKFPQFITNIQGLDIHFIHATANQQHDKKLKVVPLLLVHGCPGSFADFLKVIPLLTTPCFEYGFVFDVVCPSLPGFGFSESPHREGFDARCTAQLLLTLMDRLGYSKFYVQGYDWGAITASVMSRYYPYRVKGMHVNMCFSLPRRFDFIIKYIALSFCPFLIPSAEYKLLFPLKKHLQMFYEEMAYFHMQSTKPDTLGCALADSPAGMAACVLDRFSAGTNRHYLDLPDGGLTSKFSLDELLTSITIHWVNNNFTAGARFYKENLQDLALRTHEKLPLVVPCGVAFFPNECFMLPKFMMAELAEDLVSYTLMPRGGHFAAMEEPHLFAGDVWKFVHTVENRAAKPPFVDNYN